MKNIRAIVVVDDEATQLNLLSDIIREIVPDSTVYTAADGAEAYRIVEQYPIDLVLTDIRMPIMDGMDLIRELANRYPKIKTVLISAYQEFEYARSAIDNKVIDYIVKPYSVEHIRMTLQKVDGELADERNREQINSLYGELLQQYQRESHMQSLFRVLNKTIGIKELDPVILDKLSQYGVLALLRWKNQLDVRDKGYLRQDQQDLLIRTLTSEFPGCYIVPMEKGLDSQECRVTVIAPEITVKYCYSKVSKILDTFRKDGYVFWCGISAPCADLTVELTAALEQCEEMLSYSFYDRDTGGIYVWDDLRGNFDLLIDPVRSVEDRMRQSIHAGDSFHALGELDQLEEKYMHKPLPSSFKLRHTISSMVMRLFADLEGLLPHPEYTRLCDRAYRKYNRCDSYERLFQISRELVSKASSYHIQKTDHYNSVDKIINYINKHYSEELSLQDLASRINYSPNYLSLQIKEKTGMPYTEYVNRLRLKKAVSLLVNSNTKVVDISEQCGFNDSSYFNRVFRRYYSTTPEQYRKTHRHVSQIQ